MIRRIYLAGPDVFLADAPAVGRAKAELCRKFGFAGLFPLDAELAMENLKGREAGLAIYRGNIELMRSADAILANLTPFRGASADVGTAFEVGFFAALQKPVYAYSGDPRPFAERCRECTGATERHVDGNGFGIEDFNLPDNLMLPGAVQAMGGSWVARSSNREPKLAAFEAFEECLALLAASAGDISRAAAAG